MQFWRNVAMLSRPYWNSEEKWKARGMAALIIVLSLFLVYATTAMTFWNGEQGDSLQEKSVTKFLQSQWYWMLWVSVWIAGYVYAQYYQQLLGLRWRTWMTRDFSEKYLNDRTHYFWRFSASAGDNPDQRIAEDINGFITNFITLALGFLSSATMLVTYTIMLWKMGGTPRLPLWGGGGFVLPGYLVYAAYLWAILMSALAQAIGKKLVFLNVEQQKREADFRFSLVRVRENSESIALSGGEPAEKGVLTTRFAGIVGVTQHIMSRTKGVNVLYQMNYYLGSQVSYLVAGPLFFKGILTLGDLTKINNAFYYVQMASTFFVNSYAQIALWQAMTMRLSGFLRTAEDARRIEADARQLAHARTTVYQDGATNKMSLSVSGLNLRLPNGTPLAGNIELTLSAGNSLLVMGASGTGKSTLLRAISGIWPYADGDIFLPADFDAKSAMVLPQKPYLPLGTLRSALIYPAAPESLPPDFDWRTLLRRVQLEALESRLDVEENWLQVLSGGEQQRVALARVFIHKPRWLFLDEATAALDETGEAAVYAQIQQDLPQTAILTIGHRASLATLHQAQIAFSEAAPAVGTLG